MRVLITLRRTAGRCLLAAACAASLGGVGFSQEAPPRIPPGETFQVVSLRSSVEVTERTAKVVEFKDWLTQVDGFDPKVISVIALDKNKLRVQGLEQGVTTMIVTDRNKQVHTLEVFVSGDARLLQSVLNRAFPNSAIQATMLRGNAVLLRGWVTDAQQISSITELATLYSPNVVNQIRVGGPQEVQLRVKILEVQRSKLRQFGLNFSVLTKSAALASTPGPITPLSALTAPIGGAPTATIGPNSGSPPSLGLGVTGNQFGFQGFLQALKTEGLLKIQAEPVLVTRSGEAAEINVGGEFPIPVPQSLGTVTIEWREFGVIMQALPIVIGPTRLRQQVYAEVSEKDLSNAITMNGTTVPGLSKRRVESTVEMEFGQTLVLGGLIFTKVEASTRKTPFLGEIPGIGAAFSAKSYDFAEIELIVMITPEYVNSMQTDQMPPVGPGRTTTFPTDRELYMHGLLEVPKFGPDCAEPGGPCDPKYSVEVRTVNPRAGNGPAYVPGNSGAYGPMNPTITPSNLPSPTSGTRNPEATLPSGTNGGLIAPPGVKSGDAVPPAPSNGDPGVSSRNAGGSRNSRATTSRYDVQPRSVTDRATQVGYKTNKNNNGNNNNNNNGNNSNGNNSKKPSDQVRPATGRQAAESKSIPDARYD